MKSFLWAGVGAAVVVVIIYVLGPGPLAPESGPTVIFTPSGRFSDAERAQLTERLVDPFFDFQQEQGQRFVSMNIERSTEGAYTFTAIAEGGITHQSVIVRRGGEFEWWVPECLDGCVFSDSFKEKYPEIIRLAR